MTYGISGMATGRAAWRALFVLIACTALAGAATAASLAPERLPAIQAATFEVVAAKPVDDPLSYEKPLPLDLRSEEHTSEPQSLKRNSYAGFCLKKKKT